MLTEDGVINLTLLIGAVIIACGVLLDVTFFVLEIMRRVGILNVPDHYFETDFPGFTIHAAGAAIFIFLLVTSFLNAMR